MSGFKQGALSLDNKQSVVLPTNTGDLTLTVVDGDIKVVDNNGLEKTISFTEDVTELDLDLLDSRFVNITGDSMIGQLVIQGVETGISLENTDGACELEISSNSSNYSAVELSRFDGASKIKKIGLRLENPVNGLGIREKSGLYAHGIDDYMLFYSTEFGSPNLNIGNYTGTLNSVNMSMDSYAEFSFSDDNGKYDVWLSAEEDFRLWFNQGRSCNDVFIDTGDNATSSRFVVRGANPSTFLISAEGSSDHVNATYGNGQKVIIDKLKLAGFGGNTVTNELVLFTETGALSASGYTLDDITDLIDASQILDELPITRVGKVDVQTGLRFYTIEHDLINPELTVPLVSLTIPTSADELFVQGITDVTSGSFDVILSGTPTTSGYEINWELSTIGKGYTVKQYGVTETSSTTVTPDLSKDHVWNITLQDSTETVINAPVNMNNGQSLVLVIEQGGSVGDGTISWNNQYLFPGNVTTVATSGQGMADLYSVTKVKNRYFTSYAQEYNVL